MLKYTRKVHDISSLIILFNSLKLKLEYVSIA